MPDERRARGRFATCNTVKQRYRQRERTEERKAGGNEQGTMIAISHGARMLIRPRGKGDQHKTQESGRQIHGTPVPAD